MYSIAILVDWRVSYIIHQSVVEISMVTDGLSDLVAVSSEEGTVHRKGPGVFFIHVIQISLELKALSKRSLLKCEKLASPTLCGMCQQVFLSLGGGFRV